LLLKNETLEEQDIRRLRAEIAPDSAIDESKDKPTTDLAGQQVGIA
jgi:hypothetical protein